MNDPYCTPIRVVRRDARTLEAWKRLAQQSPGAVPTEVARTLVQRYPELRERLGYSYSAGRSSR